MSAQDIEKLSAALKDKALSPSEYVRIHCVLLKQKGYRRKEISQIHNKSFYCIEEWITKYNKEGVSGLLYHKPSKPNRAKLTVTQKEEIKAILNTKTPQEFSISEDFWDVKTLQKLLKQKFQVEYKGHSSYLRLLHYSGLSYQKAEFVDSRQSKEELEGFKKNYKIKSKKGTITMSW